MKKILGILFFSLPFLAVFAYAIACSGFIKAFLGIMFCILFIIFICVCVFIGAYFLEDADTLWLIDHFKE